MLIAHRLLQIKHRAILGWTDESTLVKGHLIHLLGTFNASGVNVACMSFALINSNPNIFLKLSN